MIICIETGKIFFLILSKLLLLVHNCHIKKGGNSNFFNLDELLFLFFTANLPKVKNYLHCLCGRIKKLQFYKWIYCYVLSDV